MNGQDSCTLEEYVNGEYSQFAWSLIVIDGTKVFLSHLGDDAYDQEDS